MPATLTPFSTASTPGAASVGVADGAGKLTPFEAEIVAVFADLVVLLGLPKSMGEIYGFIFASAEPPTFADIEQKLDLSKGSVSQGLRALRELGAIKEAGATDGGRSDESGNLKPENSTALQTSGLSPQVSSASALRSQLSGLSPQVSSPSTSASSRATRWVATTELRQLIGTLLRERLTPYLERQDQRMESAEAALNAESAGLTPRDYKALKARLTKLQTWQSRARTVLPVIGKML